MAFLLQNQTTDTVSAGLSVSGDSEIKTSGRLDGAEIQIQLGPKDSEATYQPPIGTNLNYIRAPGVVNLETYGPSFIRVKLSGSTANTNVSVEVV